MKKVFSPSIMCADLGNLKEEIHALEKAGADVFHMDIMDGEFVPNFALSWADFAVVRKLTDKPLDVHLMVKDPAVYLPYAYKNKADIVYIHYESHHAETYLHEIRSKGIKAGLAVNPETNISDIQPLFPLMDKLLLMRVHPGFAGRPAVPEVEGKIRQLSQMQRPFDIVLDGSVSSEIIEKWSRCGVEEFVLGTSVLFGKDRSYKEILQELRK